MEIKLGKREDRTLRGDTMISPILQMRKVMFREVLLGVQSVEELESKPRLCSSELTSLETGPERCVERGRKVEAPIRVMKLLFPLTRLVNISKAFLCPVIRRSMIPMISSSLEKHLFSFILTDILFYLGQRSVSY